MADESKRVYPGMPATNWWALRKRFKATPPKEVTPTYIASALSMTTQSASANVIPGLRATGLIDKAGKPTDLAFRWRDDKQYAQVCEDIRNSVYPQELLDLAPDASSERTPVQSWFARHLRVGDAAARKYTAFYFLLLDADPAKEVDNGQTAAARPRAKSTPPASRVATPRAHPTPVTPRVTPQPAKHADSNLPAPQIHFNIQVIVPNDASAETYDRIFSSISKNLLGR